MRIYPVVFAFEKDADFIWLQRKFIKKIGAPLEEHTLFVEKSFTPSAIYSDYIRNEKIRLIERPDGLAPWPSLEHCRCKIEAYRSFLATVKPDDGDYIIDMDSDAFLVGTKVLENLGKADLMGFLFTNRLTWVERFKKKWANIMGSFMMFRVGAVRKMLALPEADIRWAEKWLSTTPPFGFAHDMYIPLLLEVAGASSYYPDSGGVYCEGKGSEEILLKGGLSYSVVHLYGHWDSFGGQKIGSKYDIPSVMRKLGIV